MCRTSKSFQWSGKIQQEARDPIWFLCFRRPQVYFISFLLLMSLYASSFLLPYTAVSLGVSESRCSLKESISENMWEVVKKP